MTKDEIAQVIIDIIQEILPDEEYDSIDPDQPLREQFELDSMDFLDIVMELRKRYGIEVPESDYPKLATLNSTVEYLAPKLAAR